VRKDFNRIKRREHCGKSTDDIRIFLFALILIACDEENLGDIERIEIDSEELELRTQPSTQVPTLSYQGFFHLVLDMGYTLMF
jgi:hypothetical protein